jgi:transmembrane sensor
MTHQELRRLYEKCTSGNCTPEEQRLFEEFQDSFNLSDIPWTSTMGDEHLVSQQITRTLYSKLSFRKEVKLKRFYWIAAASILLISGFFVYNGLNSKTRKQTSYANTTKPVKIVPGSNKATLTLANGSNVVLDDTKKGLISTQSNITINKKADGQVVYQKGTTTNTNVALINTMTTPRGGQYQLTLSDGTKVWLNAETSLKYPVVFNGNERVVELSGEAYFEVAHDQSKPFKVRSNGQEVQVLGTHFNVNAYRDEQTIQTTLLQGSVKLSSKGNQVMLKPGEQASLSNTGFDVKEVDATDAIAWKNGYFLFRKESIQTVMKKVARWYDVEIEYRGSVNEKKLGGSVSRFEKITDLLSTIELTESVHFKIEGRRVIVMP